MKNEISEATSRITRMEQIFDCLCASLENSPEDFFDNPENISMLKTLTDYYESEDWLSDFELDETGRLPKDLKRGVLSEDGVWELLEALKNDQAELL